MRNIGPGPVQKAYNGALLIRPDDGEGKGLHNHKRP